MSLRAPSAQQHAWRMWRCQTQASFLIPRTPLLGWLLAPRPTRQLQGLLQASAFIRLSHEPCRVSVRTPGHRTLKWDQASLPSTWGKAGD